MSDDGPQHRELHALLLRILCGFFNVPQLFRGCETGPPAYCPYPRRLESLIVCWFNNEGKLSYFETLSVDPAGFELELKTSRVTAQCSINWATDLPTLDHGGRTEFCHFRELKCYWDSTLTFSFLFFFPWPSRAKNHACQIWVRNSQWKCAFPKHVFLERASAITQAKYFLADSQLLFHVCKKILTRGFDLLLQSCATQREAGIFATNFFLNDAHSQRNIPFCHVWSPFFLSEHFGLDERTTSLTT